MRGCSAVALLAAFAAHAQFRELAVTNDGRVLGSDPEQSGALMLWSQQGLRRLTVAETAGQAVVNDAGTRVIYQPAYRSSRLRSLDLSSGRDILLADGLWEPQVSTDVGVFAVY